MKVYFPLVLCLFLAACTTSRTPETGLYYGYLPCADCPGISYALDLEPDGTYELQSFYDERSDTPMRSSGTYRVEDNQLMLAGGDIDKFEVADGRLIVLDKSGLPISGALADRYVLSREKPSAWRMEPARQNLPAETDGDFSAFGTEPFWKVNFTDDRMSFTGLDLEPFSTPLPEPIMPADREAYAYRAQTEAGDLFVTLVPEACNDGMSDNEYAYRSEVSLRRAGAKDPEMYTGCAKFSVAEPLAGEWRVVSIDGSQIKDDKSAPTMNFDLADGRFSGSTGCNQYSGSFTLNKEARTLVPGPVMSTKMACQGSPESAFLSVLNAGELSYVLVPGRVYLRSGGKRMELGK